MDRGHMGFRAGYLLAIGGSGHVYRVGRGHERTNCPAPGMLTAKWGGGGALMYSHRDATGFASHTQKPFGTPWIDLQEIDRFVAFTELRWRTVRSGYLEPALF